MISKTQWRMEFRKLLTSIIYHIPSGTGAPHETFPDMTCVETRNERIADRLYDILGSRPGIWLAFANMDDEPCVEVAVPGVRYAYPRIDASLRTMEFFVSSSATPTWVANRFMLREPDPTDPTWTLVPRSGLSDGSVRGALIPGLGFDRKFQRLGRGAGFYDRYLAENQTKNQILKVGVAFAEQLVEELPAEPHDIGVDGVVTDRDVLWRLSAA